MWTGTATKKVDSWSLTHAFPPVDASAPSMWLSSIKHTGLVGGTNDLLATKFSPIGKPNRVDSDADHGRPPIIRNRIASIVNETGALTQVGYTEPDCRKADRMPANPHTNTLRCFPQWWTPPGAFDPVLEYWPRRTITTFDKLERSTSEVLDSLSAEQWRTSYTYEGDRVHVRPPTGSTSTTTTSDAHGRITEVRQRLGWSQQKVANIETAVSGVQPRDLDPLLDLYGVAISARSDYHDLAVLGRKQLPRRKNALRNKFEGTMRQVVDMEFSAATVSCHNSMLVPGLLQTEDCMRYLFRAHRPSLSSEQIDEYVAMGIARQEAMENTDQYFWFVINEYALLSLESVDGSSAIHDGQVRLLMNAIDRPNVEVHIAPYGNGYYQGQAETYRIFGFDTDPSVRVTYVEKYDGGDILHDVQSLVRFGSLWDQQRVHALGPEQTRPFLRKKLSAP